MSKVRSTRQSKQRALRLRAAEALLGQMKGYECLMIYKDQATTAVAIARRPEHRTGFILCEFQDTARRVDARRLIALTDNEFVDSLFIAQHGADFDEYIRVRAILHRQPF